MLTPTQLGDVKIRCTASHLGQAKTSVAMIHPGKLTWNLKMNLWKTISLYNPVVFRFHDKFQCAHVVIQYLL